MKNWKILIAIIGISSWLIACGGKNEADGDLAKKKAELEKLQNEQKELGTKIAALEAELAKLDTTMVVGKAKLVALETVGTDSFSHFIDLQGRIDAQNVVMVSPRGSGGVVRAVLVKQGQRVSKGQLLLRLDDAIAQQQVDAAATQIPGLEAQLKLAQSVYERQMNLWKNNIGTEVQVLQAKTTAENAEAQLKAAKANLQLSKENASLSNVYAEMSGVIDVVNIKVGEFFSPQSAAIPASGIRIVNTGDLKVLVQIPETYLGRVKVGTPVRVTLPELNNKVINTKLSVVSNLVDAASRTFTAEASVPHDKDLSPNQLAKVQLLDYSNNQAITIPLNTLQSDEKGKFVLVASQENGKMLARKRDVVAGELYADRVEIREGLKAGDQIIVAGYQSLYDGQLITTSQN
ncbi:MAG: efflux RND transporter periplasmic adaptor subunit [Chitinophagaceae bacterium]